jgi:molybdopterin/thiamine biosynthesis adenylyltransferase
LEPAVQGEDAVHDRQERVPGFRQDSLHAARVVLIGAGGLGGEVGEGLVRKGVGTLEILDPDLVQLSNLNRQRFFKKNLSRNKAMSLAKNLVTEATDSSVIVGHPFSFERALSRGLELDGDVIVCAVDNNGARVNVCRHYLDTRPVVYLGVDEMADHGYVFVQERPGPCFACLFPHALDEDDGGQCAKVGAVKDILKVVAGMALYVVDSLLMPRKRAWNYKEITLAGFAPGVSRCIERRERCPVCTKDQRRKVGALQ